MKPGLVTERALMEAFLDGSEPLTVEQLAERAGLPVRQTAECVDASHIEVVSGNKRKRRFRISRAWLRYEMTRLRGLMPWRAF